MLSFHWHPEPAVVAEEIDYLGVDLSDMTEPLTASVIPLIGAVEQRFEQEGPGWAPWAESYAPRAEAVNEGGILWRFGALIEGATSPASYLVTENSIEFSGAEEPDYWIFHPEGTSKMPARNFIGTDTQSEEEIVTIFAAWLDGLVSRDVGGRLRGAGGRFVAHPLASFGVR